MNKATVNQIIIATVATVTAGVILDKLRQQKSQQPIPPKNNGAWYSGVLGLGQGWS